MAKTRLMLNSAKPDISNLVTSGHFYFGWTNCISLLDRRHEWRYMEDGGAIMKIVVIGGSGFIGSKLVPKLREHGHEAIAASPNSGVNTLTGEGLAGVLKGASVVVDVSNSP